MAENESKRVFVIDVLRAYFESGAAANMEASRCCLLTAICMEFDRFYGKRAISWRVKKVIDVTGMSRNTVVDSRNELVEEGWLHVVPGVHKRKACLYTPLIPAGCDEYGHHLSSMNEDGLNIVSTLAQDSLKIVSTSSQDGLGPYIPIPSPTPKPIPTGARILDQADESELDIGTDFERKPLSDEQLWLGEVVKDWVKRLKRVAKIGPKNWTSWQDILEHTFSNNLDELVTFCRSYPGECWPDDIKKAYIKKNPQTQAAKHGRKAVEL